MKHILFTSPRKAELLDTEKPTVINGHAVIKMLRTSISSGTERANIIGDPNINYKTGANYDFPRQSGYSSCGIVEEAGDGVELKIGDRVAMSWSRHCEYVCIPKSNIYLLPDCVPDSAAALIHIGTFPLAAIRKTRLEIGESAIVMGLGVLGLTAVQLLRASGAAPIIAVDPNTERREQAIKNGADFALDPFDEKFTETVKNLTNGGAKTAIEVTGNGKALDQVLDCMAPFGRVALLGCTRNSDFTIDYYRKVHGPGITLIGAHTNARPEYESSAGSWTARDDAQALIKLHELGRIDFSKLVEDVRAPKECFEVYTCLCEQTSFPITQFDWTKLGGTK